MISHHIFCTAFVLRGREKEEMQETLFSAIAMCLPQVWFSTSMSFMPKKLRMLSDNLSFSISFPSNCSYWRKYIFCLLKRGHSLAGWEFISAQYCYFTNHICPLKYHIDISLQGGGGCLCVKNLFFKLTSTLPKAGSKHLSSICLTCLKNVNSSLQHYNHQQIVFNIFLGGGRITAREGQEAPQIKVIPWALNMLQIFRAGHVDLHVLLFLLGQFKILMLK